MIHSMTGFGKAEGTLGNKKISIQLKSLNSKQADIIVKLPSLFKEQELSLRKLLTYRLNRGKIELYLSYQAEETASSYEINQIVFANYYEQIKALQSNLGMEGEGVLNALLKMPEVVQSIEEEMKEEEVIQLQDIVSQAVDSLIQFRLDEGKTLANDLINNINQIEELLEQALAYEKERVEIVKNRLMNNLEESGQKDKVNADRFEQEMIYYLEKYDISEEKVRLKSHCDYFKETIEKEKVQGKKLGFISQEIGREINTLGSKANHAEMQKLVVQMKDHLEKIKEQVLNVL